MRVAFETLAGDRYEGKLYEIDNGTAIIKMDDGTEKACDLEPLFDPAKDVTFK